jgi:hypothetical protein
MPDLSSLTPQEQFLYQHHKQNLEGPGKVMNADGSISTIKNITIESNGRTYIIPTVWNGKFLSNQDAIKQAQAVGLEKWPSYGSEEEADARYNQLHAIMEKDVEAYRAANKTPGDVSAYMNHAGVGSTLSPVALAAGGYSIPQSGRPFFGTATNPVEGPLNLNPKPVSYPNAIGYEIPAPPLEPLKPVK